MTRVRRVLLNLWTLPLAGPSIKMEAEIANPNAIVSTTIRFEPPLNPPPEEMLRVGSPQPPRAPLARNGQ